MEKKISVFKVRWWKLSNLSLQIVKYGLTIVFMFGFITILEKNS